VKCLLVLTLVRNNVHTFWIKIYENDTLNSLIITEMYCATHIRLRCLLFYSFRILNDSNFISPTHKIYNIYLTGLNSFSVKHFCPMKACNNISQIIPDLVTIISVIISCITFRQDTISNIIYSYIWHYGKFTA
jgi:hypothetical protein